MFDSVFSVELRKAARVARDNGSISQEQFCTVAGASVCPVHAPYLEKMVLEEAASKGLSTSGTINWAQLFAALLPLILQLIALFNPPAPAPVP